MTSSVRTVNIIHVNHGQNKDVEPRQSWLMPKYLNQVTLAY